MLSDASISEYLCPWRCFTLREKIQKLFGVYFGGHWEITPPICFSIRDISPLSIRLTRQLFQSNRPCKTFVCRGIKSEPILYHISSLWNIIGEKSGSSLFAIKKERDRYGYKEIASDHPYRRRVRREIQSPSNWWEEESGHFIRYRNVQYTSIAKPQEEHRQKYTQEIGDRAGCLSCLFLYPCLMHLTGMFSLQVGWRYRQSEWY